MKLNGSRIARAIHEAGCTIAESDLAARLALVELSDIITEEGGPPNTLSLDDQLSGLLAAWKAMRAAGEEMPSTEQIMLCIGDAFADHQVINSGRVRAQAEAILDHFRHIIARLKQERDEARAKSEPDDSCFVVPTMAENRDIEIAERNEQETALQLAQALARVKELEARLAGALVPLPKPEKVEVGQRWAFVMTAGETAGSIAPYIRSWHMSDGICRFRVDIPSNMNCIKTSMRYLGDGNEQR